MRLGRGALKSASGSLAEGAGRFEKVGGARIGKILVRKLSLEGIEPNVSEANIMCHPSTKGPYSMSIYKLLIYSASELLTFQVPIIKQYNLENNRHNCRGDRPIENHEVPLVQDHKFCQGADHKGCSQENYIHVCDTRSQSEPASRPARPAPAGMTQTGRFGSARPAGRAKAQGRAA